MPEPVHQTNKKPVLQRWVDVDAYVGELFAPADELLTAALTDSDAAALPAINVSANQGKMLYIFAKLVSARKILEIGTLGGYSSIWLARSLPDGGRLITLESEPKHAAVAARNIARAQLDDRVEVRVGSALDTLPQLVDEKVGPFDLIFIDAEKTQYVDYLEWSLRLSRLGTLIIADNVVRDGEVVETDSIDERVHGVRAFNECLARDKRLDATIVQTVGSKGYDGFAMALVTASISESLEG